MLTECELCEKPICTDHEKGLWTESGFVCQACTEEIEDEIAEAQS